MNDVANHKPLAKRDRDLLVAGACGALVGVMIALY